MKPKHRFLSGCIALVLTGPAVADTIYSNLQNITIPTDFTGVTVNINGGTINPFFGGVGVANNSLFQPVRSGTGNLDTIQNLTVGSVVDVSQLFSTGSGGSSTHLGTTFTAGTEGNIGFRLNGTDYGWMRVVFTGNTSGAVIKDWAYDNSGQSIVVGRVNQSAAVSGAQTVTLSPGTGESFTLGSVISNTDGNTNSVNKTGAGTTILSQINSYTGTTTVNDGELLVNGSNTGNGSYSVGASGTLGGTGSLGTSTINVTGVLSPGASVQTLSSGTVNFTTGSSFAYEVDSSVSTASGADLQIISGDLNLTGTVTLTFADLASSPVAFANGTIFSLINYSGGWNNGIFNFHGNVIADDTTFTAGLNMWQIDYNAAEGGLNYSSEYLGGGDSFVNITAVPEPSAALLGGLGMIALLRRRRP